MALGKKVGDEVVVAAYGRRVEILDRILYNPTDDIYLAMGFGILPTSNPPEGYHDEWYVEDDEIKVRSVQDAEEPEAPLRRKFSKGEFLEALQACKLYELVKAAYVQDVDMQIAFAGFADIDMDFSVTQSMMEKYSAVFTDENVNKLQRYITFKEIPE